MMSKLQQQQQQFQQLRPLMQQCPQRPDLGKSGLHGTIGAGAVDLHAAALQHHSHSAILAAYPGGMVRFMPGQYPAGPGTIHTPHMAPVGFLQENPNFSMRAGTSMQEAGGTPSQSKSKTGETSVVSPGHVDQSVTGMLSYENTVRSWNRGSQPASVSTYAVAAEQPMELSRRASPVVSPPVAQQAFPQGMSSQGIYGHASVSPTSVYNPGITYPFPYPAPGGCYPYWMNYPGTAPAGVAYASGSPQEMSPGLPQQWSTSTSPSDESRLSDTPSPWSGQILAGCTTDWLQNPIVHYPTLTAQHISSVPCATTTAFTTTQRQEYQRKEFRGLASSSSSYVPMNFEIPGPNRGATSSTQGVAATEINKASDSETTSCVAGRSSEHLVPLDFAERFSPIRREYNLSPYLCYPSSRDCTPTKSMTDCEKSSWMSPLNTPEVRSQASSQMSSRVTSPVSESNGQTIDTSFRQENERAVESETRGDMTGVVKAEENALSSAEETD